MKTKSLLLGVASALTMTTALHAERASDGNVGIIYWQAPSILNPYLSGGTKDIESSSLVIEALGGYDPTGAMYARLAAEIPTVANGGISSDLTSITWKLKPGVMWSDGTPFTSADVAFTADYCIGEPGCYQEAKFEGVKSIDAIDDLRPYLKNDGGDMELVDITPEKKVLVRFLGACKSCSVRPVTLKAGLEESLKVAAPEISGVESVEN